MTPDIVTKNREEEARKLKVWIDMLDTANAYARGMLDDYGYQGSVAQEVKNAMFCLGHAIDDLTERKSHVMKALQEAV